MPAIPDCLRCLALVLTVGSCSSPAPSPDGVPDPGIDVVELTAEQIQVAYARGDYTAVQLTRAFLARIARYEDRYNAFISMNPQALATAADLDEEYAATGPRSSLHGVPVVVKDNMDFGGLVTTAGYSGFSSSAGGLDMVPDDDAAVVERLRQAGAIILGKTNMPDFASHGTRTNSTVAGVTLNPYNVAKAPGGSSGGTATAVNGSFAVLGLGSETGGSIQNPAASQALVGVKPTFGLVPVEGVVPINSTYVDVVGPLAKTVHDAAVTLDIIAGPTIEDLATFASEGHIPEAGYASALSTTALQGKRFGLVGPGWRQSYLPLAPETRELYQQAITALQARGAEVVEDPFADSDFVELYRSRSRVPTQGTHDMLVYLQGLGEGAAFNSTEEYEKVAGQPFRGRRTARGSRGRRGGNGARGGRGRRGGRSRGPARPSATEEGDAFQAWRKDIRALFRTVLADHELDGLFFPQAGAPIPDLVEDPERPDYNPNNHPEIPSNIVNHIGLPVVTVPFAYYYGDTPFVLAFIGDLWTEAELLAYAYDFEQATRARVPPELRPRE